MTQVTERGGAVFATRIGEESGSARALEEALALLAELVRVFREGVPRRPVSEHTSVGPTPWQSQMSPDSNLTAPGTCGTASGIVSAPAQDRTPSLGQLLWQVPFSGFVWSAGFAVMIGSFMVAAARARARTPVEQSLWSAKAFAQVLKLTGSKVEVSYDPSFDRERPSVFCQNHVNLMDAHMACRAIPQPFVGLMLAWHFKIPGYGWMMRTTNGIPVHPASAGRTRELTRAAKDRAENGLSILTFPEGHRTLDGKMRRLKRGIFFMARDAGMPIVPLAVRGMYELMHKGSMLVSPAEIQVYVGPQVETAGLGDAGIRELASVLGDAMNDYVEGRDVSGASLSALAGWKPETGTTRSRCGSRSRATRSRW